MGAVVRLRDGHLLQPMSNIKFKAIKDQFNPRCVSTLTPTGRDKWPHFDGVKCRICSHPRGLSDTCCCGCFVLEWPGLSGITGCGSLNDAFGRTIYFSISVDQCGLPTDQAIPPQVCYWRSKCGGNVVGVLRTLYDRDVDTRIVTATIMLTFFGDLSSPSSSVTYTCPDFTCSGGQFDLSSFNNRSFCGGVTAPSTIGVANLPDCTNRQSGNCPQVNTVTATLIGHNNGGTYLGNGEVAGGTFTPGGSFGGQSVFTMTGYYAPDNSNWSWQPGGTGTYPLIAAGCASGGSACNFFTARMGLEYSGLQYEWSTGQMRRLINGQTIYLTQSLGFTSPDFYAIRLDW
jgi:hypothetical protein